MECECEVNPEGIEVLRSIFRIVLKFGRSPTIKELRSSLKRSDEDIIRGLDELEKKGLFLRKRGTQEIVSIYPLSLKPTQHQITLEYGPRLFAMCAVDALGMPIMFNKNVRIISRCEECREKMFFEIRNGEITYMSHQDATICSPKTQVYPAAKTCCPLVNFFCSKKHADDWIKKNLKQASSFNQKSIKQVFPKIKECWKSYGETLGI